jgi:hypothetical protein
MELAESAHVEDHTWPPKLEQAGVYAPTIVIVHLEARRGWEDP